MHLLSELRNPLFDPPDRERALRALKLSRLLKEDNHTKPWQAVKSMIDRIVADNNMQHSQQSQNSGSVARPSVPTTQPPLTNSANPNFTVFTERPSTFSTPETSQTILSPPVQPSPLQPMQSVYTDQTQFNWDDLNFSNIVDGPYSNNELPEFDFVSHLHLSSVMD